MGETPIYDQVARERAAKDPEGLALVRAIHERKQAEFAANPYGIDVVLEAPRKVGFREVLIRGWWR